MTSSESMVGDKRRTYKTLKSAILISATEWSNGLVV